MQTDEVLRLGHYRVGPAGIYLLTPDGLELPRLLAATDAALAAGIRWVQLRNKTADAPTRRAQARALRTLTRTRKAFLIVNDDAELACEVEADGVHIGRDDGAIETVRRRIGAARVLGVSCYDDLARAQAAARAGADYVAFGSMYPSRVKPDAVRAPLALLGRARAAGMRVVAIGGIEPTRVGEVAAAGAHAAALISAVYDAADPGRAAAQLAAAFTVAAVSPEIPPEPTP
jgi:thiamine-phosphate pyrophosphorylase